MIIVLVGVPADGNRFAINGDDPPPEINIAKYEPVRISLEVDRDDLIVPPHIEKIIYYRLQFNIGPIVYVWEEMSETEVVLKLIQGYNPDVGNLRGR